jgi:tRNA dimethylallyltransferase
VTKRAVLIAGPTASGKSGFAMALAKRIDGVIVNADSMQVYDGLRILTARPSAEDEQTSPHRLYGHVPPAMRYSVGRWLRDVSPVLDAIWQSGQHPIIVGGTGLYFKALTEGIAETPHISEAEHAAFVAKHAETDIVDLQQHLASVDPVSANRIERNDRQRTLRALMILDLTGQTLSDWQDSARDNAILPLEDTVHRVLMPADRNWLYNRIETRFHAMLDEGGEAEALYLLKQGLPDSLPVMSAISLPHYARFPEPPNAVERADIVEKSVRDTRRYAKRQMTWFRNQMAAWQRLDPMAWVSDDTKMQKDLRQIAQELEKQA